MRKNSTYVSKTKEIDCARCGKKAGKGRGDYKFKESGLDNVVLTRINIYKCSCGQILPQVRDEEKLYWGIALSLVRKSSLLTGKEIKFLIKMMRRVSVIARLIELKTSLMEKLKRSEPSISVSDDRDVRMLYIASITSRYQEILQVIHGMEAFKFQKKYIREMENSDFKRAHDAISSKFRLIGRQLKRLRHRKTTALVYCRYIARGRGGSWRIEMRQHHRNFGELRSHIIIK